MRPRRSILHKAPGACGASALLALATLASAASAQGPDPFAPHLRWSEPAPAAAPWLPRSVDFAGGEELVLAAGSVGTPTALALSASDLSGSHLIGQLDLADASGTVQVAAGAGPDQLFLLGQHPLTGPSDRIHRVTGAAAVPGGGLTRLWSTDLGSGGNGTSALAVARETGALRVAIETGGALELFELEPLTGAVVASFTHAGSGSLRALELSDDGRRLALLSGSELLVFDDAGPVFSRTLSQVTNALALSGDGHTLAVGDAGGVQLLAEGPGGYLELEHVAAAPGQVPVRLALDAAGLRLAAGHWVLAGGQAVHFEVRDRAGVLLFEHDQVPGPSGLQNYPEAVALTGDGRRAAFASWGVGDAQPEVLLVDVDTAAVVLSVDLSGSARGLALAPSGTRVAVAHKHAHANQFASTGEVSLFDSGERELQFLERSTPTGKLELSSLRPGAKRALFLVGLPAPQPVTFLGAGQLFLLRSGPLRVKGAFPDATGRADVSFSVPSLLGSVGPDLAVQAAWRMTGGLELGLFSVPLLY